MSTATQIKANRCISPRIAAFDSLPALARVNSAEVSAITGIAQRTLAQMVRQGRWPAPTKVVGSGRATWSVGQVRSLIKGGEQ